MMGEKFLTWLVIVMGLSGFVLVSLQSCNDSQAKRLYAEAALTGAKSAARQDFLAAALPYIVFGSIAIALAGAAAVIIYALAQQGRPDAAQPTHIIETRTILILQPGQHSRREIYQLLSGTELENQKAAIQPKA